jgi:hypothetical protein
LVVAIERNVLWWYGEQAAAFGRVCVSMQSHPIQHLQWRMILDDDLDDVIRYIGTMGDMVSSLISYFLGDGMGAMLSDVVATHLWAISGLCALGDWIFEQRSRKYHSAPVQMTMLPWRISEQPLVIFDWFGWGDWFFLPGGILYATGAYTCTLIKNTDLCWSIELAAAVCFLIDALLYFPQLEHMKRTPELYTRASPSQQANLVPLYEQKQETTSLLPR